MWSKEVHPLICVLCHMLINSLGHTRAHTSPSSDVMGEQEMPFQKDLNSGNRLNSPLSLFLRTTFYSTLFGLLPWLLPVHGNVSLSPPTFKSYVFQQPSGTNLIHTFSFSLSLHPSPLPLPFLYTACSIVNFPEKGPGSTCPSAKGTQRQSSKSRHRWALTLSFTSKVHCGGCGKWAVVLCTINWKEEPGLTSWRYCFHRIVPELLSIPKS